MCGWIWIDCYLVVLGGIDFDLCGDVGVCDVGG